MVLGAIDLLRVVQISNTVADAARQGARQGAANAVAADQPFGAWSGSCSGTTATASATGTGCLTDAAVTGTVTQVLGPASRGSTLYTASAAGCPTPPSGYASVCISPGQAARDTEWSAPAQQGSFLLSVTVVVSYSPMTPVASGVFPAAFKLASTTSMVTEY